MKKILHFIISLLSNIIPKSDRIFVFASFPDFTDNSYAMYRYLKEKHVAGRKYIWIFENEESFKKYPGVKAYRKYSLPSFYYFARARNIFFTHGLYSFVNLRSKDKVVNLWHGMPLKVIGLMDTNGGATDPTRADYLIATSPFFQRIMSNSFKGIDIAHTLLTGQPRNDMLFTPTDFFTNRGIVPGAYRSIGIWLPTYRQSIIGDIRNDGIYNSGGISFLNMDELARLDYLLTAYRSVWVDYSILTRPLGFVMDDIEQYGHSRGFTVDNLTERLPGPVIGTYGELESFISSPSEFNGSHQQLFNTYCDNNSSERLAKALGIE